MPLRFIDGTVLDSSMYSLRGLVRLSRQIGDSDAKLSQDILRAIARKGYSESPYLIEFDRPVTVRGRDIWYVRHLKASHQRLQELLLAILEQNPGDAVAIRNLEQALGLEPSQKRQKLRIRIVLPKLPVEHLLP